MHSENMAHDHKCRVRVWAKVKSNDYGFIIKHKDLFDVRSDWVYRDAGHGEDPCDNVEGATKRPIEAIQTAMEYRDWANSEGTALTQHGRH